MIAARLATDSGSTRISFQCGNPDYVTARVLAAKGAIRVLAGPRLQKRIAEELAATQEHYQQ